MGLKIFDFCFYSLTISELARIFVNRIFDTAYLRLLLEYPFSSFVKCFSQHFRIYLVGTSFKILLCGVKILLTSLVIMVFYKLFLHKFVMHIFRIIFLLLYCNIFICNWFYIDDKVKTFIN